MNRSDPFTTHDVGAAKGGWRTIAVLLVGLSLGGCVQRQLVVESDPTGAHVFFDGFLVGQTPATIEFHHYGTHEVILRHDKIGKGSTAETFQPRVEMVQISPPWYQYFPIDLLAEFWPGGIVDEHRIRITLDRSDSSQDIDAFEAKAVELGVFPAEPPEDEAESKQP